MSKNVALVLSGGGAKGNAHIGVIEELLERGYNITSIAGTSMGSLIGGVYATGKLLEFKDWMCALDRFKVFQLVDFTLSNQGVIKGDKVLKTIKDFIGDRNIEDLSIPYAAVAADILQKQEVVFTKGNMFDAIRASIAIPTVLTPVKHNGSLMVDGGVINNLPINRVQRNKGDILIAVNVNAEIEILPPIKTDDHAEKQSAYQVRLQQFQQQLHKLSPKKKKEDIGYFDLLNKTLQFMMRFNVQQTINTYKPDVMIDISQETCGTFDFFKAEEVISHGRYSAQVYLDTYEGKR